jgi:sugar porter (SP) family MFS transporter
MSMNQSTSHSNMDDVELGTGNGKADLKPNRTKPFIVLVASLAALGGLIFGYDVAGAGGTFLMEGFKLHFGWECADGDTSCTPATDSQQALDMGLINGLFGVGATIGAFGGTFVADKYGRRACIFVAAVTFIFGAALQAGAPDMDMMWAGRVFSGMGIGAMSMSVPVYIAELSPDHVRGKLNTLWQLAITMGILIASAANLGLQKWSEGWRISYGGNILFAIILILGLFIMPESPRWLTGHGYEEGARQALEKIRYEDEIDSEMKKLMSETAQEMELGVATWREVFAKDNKMRYRLFLGISLQAVQQLCGINAIMFYAPTILNEFFGEKESIIGTFILNLINMLSTFIALYAVERAGRVKLLLSGAVIMVLSLIANAVLASLPATATIGYVVTVFAAIFIIGFAYSWGPVVWVVCAEIFPLRERAKATGLTTMTNWICTTIVGAVFPAASNASLAGTFGFFAGMISIGFVIVYAFEAETAGKSILEIDEAYAKHKPKIVRKEL